MVTALIDGDISAYRCAAVSEDTDEEICILRLDKQIRDILYSTDASHYKIYLTGSNNFRKVVYPEYKANRKDKPLPKWLNACREYLVTQWQATVSDGCEADDLLGANQTEDTIIVSIDKDLLQIPGRHFNFVKMEEFFQTPMGGIRHFYEQLLKGDRSDNVPGVDKIGEKKAARYLEGCETEQEMFDVCRSIYNDDSLMEQYGKCLWIWRHEGDIWDMSKLIGDSQLNSEAGEPSGSTTPREVVTTQCMGPTTPETDGFPLVGV